MNRIRSFSSSTRSVSKNNQRDNPFTIMSPYLSSPAHSRDSSAASSLSSPSTSTFPSRGHRHSCSNSSSVSSPDSVSTAPTSKTTLHDLVEEPAERDEFYDDDLTYPMDEPLCICDTTFCIHRLCAGPQSVVAMLATPPEWTPGDDYFSDGQLPGQPVIKRQRSGELSTDGFTFRLSRHLPSLKRRFPSHRASASISTMNKSDSAPPSRHSSLRLPAKRSVTMPATLDTHILMTPPFSPIQLNFDDPSSGQQRARARSQTSSRPVDIGIPAQQQDPIDREGLASTPLLPPMMAEYFNDSSEGVQSPLQSPTVASLSAAASVANTPVLPAFPTPPLSAKQSTCSLQTVRSGLAQAATPLAEISPLTIAEETDPWAIKLGHANFHILPEPYVPDVCDKQTCQRLQDNWEAARIEYMRQAARVSEHYGVTSQTYKLTEQKWDAIDQQWRDNHAEANSKAQASGDSPVFQPLPETQAVSSVMPTLNDPHQPFKFPAVEDKDIVGPMVRYAKIHGDRRSSRKPAFLKLFTDPAGLLSGRSTPNR